MPAESLPSPPTTSRLPDWLNGRAAWRVVAAVGVVFMILFTVPWQPVASATIGAFDYALYLSLHEAVASGRQFGRDVIVPQGPLGFLGTGVYHPATYAFLVLGRTLIAVGAFWTVWRVARQFIPNALLALAWLLVVITLIGRSPDHFFPACGLLLLLTYFIVDERRRPGAAVYVLVAILAAASLFKVSQPLYAAVTLVPIVLDRAWRRDFRWMLAVPLAYVGCLALFYVAARQSPGNAMAFVRGWLNILRGHGDAVGLPGLWIDPAAYLFAAACVLAVVVATEKRRGGAGGGSFGVLMLSGATAGVFLLLYKHSFTRQDFWHANIGPMVITAAGLLYLPAALRVGERYLRAGAIAATALGGIVTVSILASYNGEGLLGYAGVVAARCADNATAITHLLTDSGRLRREWDAHRQHIREEFPLRIDESIRAATVDVYPHRQDVVLAYDLRYAPRPAISSLMATSPALARLNAEHLRGFSAPDVVLFDVAELVDNNFPTILDGASLPELLTRYDVADASGGMLVLRKRPTPRAYRFEPLSTTTGHFEQPIAVPESASAPLWVRMRFKPLAMGRLLSLLYKPVTVGIEILTRDGSVNSYRLLPTLAEEQGFLLSPLIQDRGGYARLASNKTTELAPAEVISIRVLIADELTDVWFAPEFEVTFERLKIER